jgi:hypothetical protein
MGKRGIGWEGEEGKDFPVDGSVGGFVLGNQ